MKRVAVLGSTGSIGGQVLDVGEKYLERYSIVGLSAYRSVDKIIEQIERYKPKYACIADKRLAAGLNSAFLERNVMLLEGSEGLEELAGVEEADVVVIAIPGSAGLRPTLRAIEARKTVLDSNKESFAIAGQILMREARRSAALFLPLDGEHLAIHQCLNGERSASIRRIILTASGGAFRDVRDSKELQCVSWRDALRHPTWSMGSKITVDSATLMNKGLEVIVAHHFFDLPYDKIDVIIHRESIVHSIVEFVDGSMIAQLSVNDMRLAALYALSYPERLAGRYDFLDLVAKRQLSFEEPRVDLFPCLRLAIEAGREGGIMPAVLNASNEVAVDAFLRERIRFVEIPQFIERMMSKTQNISDPSLDDIFEIDRSTRRLTEEAIQKVPV